MMDAQHMGVMHQVVTAQLAARRAGTHSTKGRAPRWPVAGRKPWRQKGTGQGPSRLNQVSPQWRGGGAAHGPKPRELPPSAPPRR